MSSSVSTREPGKITRFHAAAHAGNMAAMRRSNAGRSSKTGGPGSNEQFRKNKTPPYHRKPGTTTRPSSVTVPIAAQTLEEKRAQAEAMYPQLNPDQKYVRERILEGDNLFITGEGGVGKSLLWKRVMACDLIDVDKHGSTAVTSSTGITAVAVSGCTFHSFMVRTCGS